MEFEKYIKSISYQEAKVSHVQFDFSLESRPLFEVLSRQRPELALRWVGRFSAFEAIAAEWSLAIVAESAFSLKAPRRGIVIRAVFAEWERVRWCYRYLSQIFEVSGDQLRSIQARSIVEAISDHIELLAGSRFLPQIICLGGVTRDLSMGDVSKSLDLCRWVTEKSRDLMADVDKEIFMTYRWHKGLRIPEDFFEELGVSGPVGQASGLAWDIRQLKPYFPYTQLHVSVFKPETKDLQEGNAGKHFHRIQSVSFQARQAIGLLQEMLGDLPRGSCQEKVRAPSAWPMQDISSVVEAPSGAMKCTLSNGKVAISSFSMKLSPKLEELLSGTDCDDLGLSFHTLGYDFAQGALI